jgi:hypothetical protein
MATTTNYGWTTPDDTALVKDGASAIRSLGSSVDTTVKALNPETTLGDIAYRSSTANTNTRLGIGTTGQVLTVSGGVPAWATPAGSSGPAFRAYLDGSSQNFNQNTFTKIQFNAETFDTDNCFDSTTNYRFTPNKAGYYQITIGADINQTESNKVSATRITKNGTGYAYTTGAIGIQSLGSGTDLVYLNGTTDYVEGFAYSESGTSRYLLNGSASTYFSGVWIRS